MSSVRQVRVKEQMKETLRRLQRAMEELKDSSKSQLTTGQLQTMREKSVRVSDRLAETKDRFYEQIETLDEQMEATQKRLRNYEAIFNVYKEGVNKIQKWQNELTGETDVVRWVYNQKRQSKTKGFRRKKNSNNWGGSFDNRNRNKRGILNDNGKNNNEGFT